MSEEDKKKITFENFMADREKLQKAVKKRYEKNQLDKKREGDRLLKFLRRITEDNIKKFFFVYSIEGDIQRIISTIALSYYINEDINYIDQIKIEDLISINNEVDLEDYLLKNASTNSTIKDKKYFIQIIFQHIINLRSNNISKGNFYNSSVGTIRYMLERELNDYFRFNFLKEKFQKDKNLQIFLNRTIPEYANYFYASSVIERININKKKISEIFKNNQEFKDFSKEIKKIYLDDDEDSFDYDYLESEFSDLKYLNQENKDLEYLKFDSLISFFNLDFKAFKDFKNLKKLVITNNLFNYEYSNLKNIEIDLSIFFVLKNLKEIVFEGNRFTDGNYEVYEIDEYDEYNYEDYEENVSLLSADNGLWDRITNLEKSIKIRNRIIECFNNLEILSLSDVEIISLDIFKNSKSLKKLYLKNCIIRSTKFSYNVEIFNSLKEISIELKSKQNCDFLSNFKKLNRIKIKNANELVSFSIFKNHTLVKDIEISKDHNPLLDISNFDLSIFKNSKIQSIKLLMKGDVISLEGLKYLHNLKYIELQNFEYLINFNTIQFCKNLEFIKLINIKGNIDLKILKKLPKLINVFIKDCKIENFNYLKNSSKITFTNEESLIRENYKPKKWVKIGIIDENINNENIIAKSFLITDEEYFFTQEYDAKKSLLIQKLDNFAGSILAKKSKAGFIEEIVIHLNFPKNTIQSNSSKFSEFIVKKKVMSLPLKSNKIIIGNILHTDNDEEIRRFNVYDFISTEQYIDIYEVNITDNVHNEKRLQRYGYMLKPRDEDDYFEEITNN